jgi:hypothetical protein
MLLRKVAEGTIEATRHGIGALLQCFTPAECANYIKNAGYASAPNMVNGSVFWRPTR